MTDSERLRSVWAKSRVDELGRLDGWLPLYQHLDDAAETAGLLWDEWAPTAVKHTIASAFGSEKSARSILVWLAGTHDVGKASPAFAVQVPALAEAMKQADLPIDSRIVHDTQRSQVRHEVVSHIAIHDWLQEVHRLNRRQASAIASIAAAHHGNPPGPAQIMKAANLTNFIGTDTWVTTRGEFLARADRQWTTPGAHEEWGEGQLTQPVLVLLNALVIVADWIASSAHFPAVDLGTHPVSSGVERAAGAWKRLGFPAPWHAQPVTTDARALLTSRFTLPSGATPHPTQVSAVELAKAMSQPELMIIEAEMGSGKTEAALLAAEILASRFGLSGIFVGLPTRATADGMFGRVLEWAHHLDLPAPVGIQLAHGSSSLNPDFEALTETSFRAIGAQPTGDHDAVDEPVIAHRWFSSPRRGPLASFVVGTVDQALFAGHRSRYVMLRHLAFASKVVVIDEAHAYDDFMSAYLNRFLEWLGAYGVPVIMLSATLPSARRAAYHSAYERGRRALLPPDGRSIDAETPTDTPSLAAIPSYPLVSATNESGPPTELFPDAPRGQRRVELGFVDDDGEALVALVTDALREGGCLAIIRNTVRRAQETAALLRARTSIPVTVAHSHFLAVDRAVKDRDLVERFGPRGDRPTSHIVVATQVIEQSLDVDFDLMISDIAPIDLLLQRVGRLHRHKRTSRPHPVAAPKFFVAGTDATTSPPSIDRGARRVYGEFLLLRTLAVLQGRTEIILPDDIAPLVETVYGPDDTSIPGEWRERYEQAKRAHEDKKRSQERKASTFVLGPVGSAAPTLLGWIAGPDIDPELAPPGRATVRDSEGDTLEVIMLQRTDDGVLRTPAWLGAAGGTQIPDNDVPDGALTRTLLGCKLRLPVGMCANGKIDAHIAALERAFELPHWHSSHLLKGELALVVDAKGHTRLNGFNLDYSPLEGLRFSEVGAAARGSGDGYHDTVEETSG